MYVNNLMKNLNLLKKIEKQKETADQNLEIALNHKNR